MPLAAPPEPTARLARAGEASGYWLHSKDGDSVGYELYRRHYSAKKNPRPKQRQFVGPGEKMVLIGRDGNALFAWRKFIDDSGQTGVNCAVFRNESAHRSSDMIREAMAAAWEWWPDERLYTTVDAGEVRSTNPGYCFIQAGWRRCGTTKRGLVILEAFPSPVRVSGPPVAVTDVYQGLTHLDWAARVARAIGRERGHRGGSQEADDLVSTAHVALLRCAVAFRVELVPAGGEVGGQFRGYAHPFLAAECRRAAARLRNGGTYHRRRDESRPVVARPLSDLLTPDGDPWHPAAREAADPAPPAWVPWTTDSV